MENEMTFDPCCHAVPPHPDLKRRLREDLDRFKQDNAGNYLLNRLVLGNQTKPGLDDGLIYPGHLFPLGTSMGPVRMARAQQQPLRGTLNVMVVLVDFSDRPMAATPASYQDLFFSTGVVPTGSVREYYQEVTNGKINIQGNIFGPYRMPQTSAYYADGHSGTGLTSPNAQTMAHDAAVAIGATVDFSGYDNDHDGFVDAFIVIHAGSGAEVTNNPNDIWSHKWLIEGGAYTGTLSSTQIYGYLTVPEDCKLGVCAHELGHLLFGFPDLYDTTGASEGIGDWCLMSGGSWNNNGLTPAHPSAWCKANQGWVSIDIPKANQAGVTIDDVKTGFTVKKLWKNGIPGNEYFLVENRQLAKFDQYLPGAGLLVWHIDDSIADNTNPNHYKVALLQADGLRQLESNTNEGDAGDPFPGTTANTTFDMASNPGSLSYGGVDSSVQILNIVQAGNSIQCDLNVS